MAMTKHEIISTLNDLIATCKDGESGYKTAAEGVEKSEYKLLFKNYAEQRERFAAELQEGVQHQGGDPKESGTISGSIHRGWMNIKSAVSGKNEAAVVSECERGEDAAVSLYREMLKRDLPDDVRSLVEHQYAQVKEAHDRIRALEKAVS